MTGASNVLISHFWAGGANNNESAKRKERWKGNGGAWLLCLAGLLAVSWLSLGCLLADLSVLRWERLSTLAKYADTLTPPLSRRCSTLDPSLSDGDWASQSPTDLILLALTSRNEGLGRASFPQPSPPRRLHSHNGNVTMEINAISPLYA